MRYKVKKHWTPFEPAVPKNVKDFKPGPNVTAAWFMNSRYLVSRDEFFEDETKENLRFVVLSVRRLDRGDHFPWRDLQLIKNELLGRELDAIEIFPAESRLVDTANQRYLWFAPSMPRFGFEKREVTELSVNGSRNSKFSPEHRPKDLVKTEEELRAIDQRMIVPEMYDAILAKVVENVSALLDRVPGVPKEGNVIERLEAIATPKAEGNVVPMKKEDS